MKIQSKIISVHKFLLVGLLAVGQHAFAQSDNNTYLKTGHHQLQEFVEDMGADLYNGVPTDNHLAFYHKIFQSIVDNDASQYPKQCSGAFKKLQKDYWQYDKVGMASINKELDLDGNGPKEYVKVHGVNDLEETIAKEVYTGKTNAILKSHIQKLRQDANQLGSCAKIKRDI